MCCCRLWNCKSLELHRNNRGLENHQDIYIYISYIFYFESARWDWSVTRAASSACFILFLFFYPFPPLWQPHQAWKSKIKKLKKWFPLSPWVGACVRHERAHPGDDTCRWCLCTVAMVAGSLQEGARSAEKRSVAPPGGEPAEGQHGRLRPHHAAALLLLSSHQTGR